MNRQADVDAVNEAWSHRRYDMSAEEIKEFTDQVVATPGCVVADVHHAWNREHPGKEISYSVAARYINHYLRHEQNSTENYYVPEKKTTDRVVKVSDVLAALMITSRWVLRRARWKPWLTLEAMKVRMLWKALLFMCLLQRTLPDRAQLPLQL